MPKRQRISYSEEEDSQQQKRRIKTMGIIESNVKYNCIDRDMKKDHKECPLMVGELIKKFYNEDKVNKKSKDFEYVVEIFLETFTPNFSECYEFVVQIAQPKSRQEYIQSYEINSASLFASITLGLTYKKILEQLNHFNKFVKIGSNIKEFIKRTTSQYGKARLVLENNNYYIESEDIKVIEYYYNLATLQGCWDSEIITINTNNIVEDQTNVSTGISMQDQLLNVNNNEQLYQQFEELTLINDDQKQYKRSIYRLQIKHNKLDIVRIARDSGTNRYKYMLNQEYAYEQDESKSLQVQIKSNVKIRMYQEKALNRVFVKGRARSGIIVLPCGAGKTLVGILCMCQIKKKTLVLCINNLNVRQWAKQIQNFTNINPNRIIKFTSDQKKNKQVPSLDEPCVVLSTYTMISRKDDQRSEQARKLMQQVASNEWGLLILDEVQVAPAEVFKKAFLTKTVSHCKIGLTATLIREDNKIEDLQFYIGPKLYEESWIELTKQGFLAKVQCVEIRVDMPFIFKKEYERRKLYGSTMGIYLQTGNPNKFIVLQYLIEVHKNRGDKILIFIDTIDILIEFARLLGYPYICGDVSEYEREKILQFFRVLDEDWNVVLISRVGDVGIDLPDANVAIEVSSLFGSRRQEAQRLGRILRPKEKKTEDKYHSYFYSLISTGTEEIKYGFQRQKFLIKQGYSFKTIHEKDLPYNNDLRMKNSFKMTSDLAQHEFLQKIVTQCQNRQKERDNVNEWKTFKQEKVKEQKMYDFDEDNIFIENNNQFVFNIIVMDETFINIKLQGKPYLGSKLCINFDILEQYAKEQTQLSPKEIRKKTEINTEWILIDSTDKKVLSILKGNDLILDYQLYRKGIKVHASPKIEGMQYFGMPYQDEIECIELDQEILKQMITNKDLNRMVLNQNVTDIYKSNAEKIEQFVTEMNQKFPNFFSYSKFDQEQLQNLKKKVKTIDEEKIYWKTNFERQKKELTVAQENLSLLEKQQKENQQQIDYLLQEKNFFMNSRILKTSTNENSFLDEKSHEFSQSKLIGFGANNIQPIPMQNNNNILELTMLDDDMKQTTKVNEELEQKVQLQENMLKNLKKELDHYRQVYSQTRIDEVIEENKSLKLQINSMENQLKEYKEKLLKFDFAYKYITKEFENLKSFSRILQYKDLPDENFLQASNLVQKLTQEIFHKNQQITELHNKVKKLKNEMAHNQTF